MPQNAARLFSVGLVLVAVMLASVGWTLLDARRTERRQAETAASNITLTLERDLGGTVHALDVLLQAAVRAMAINGLAEMKPNIQHAILFNGLNAATSDEAIYISDEAGRVIYASREVTAGTADVSNRSFFQMHRDHADRGLLIGNPEIMGHNGQLGLCLSRRINHPDGSFAGVVVVGLPVDYILSLFRGIEVGEDGAIVLVDNKGVLMARWPYTPKDIGRDLSGGRMFKLLASNPAGILETPSLIDGKTRIYYYRQVANFPLIVCAGLALPEVYGDWNRKTAIVGTVLVSLCLLKITLSFLLRRELIRRSHAEESARRAAVTAEGLARDLARALGPIDTLFNNSVDTMQVIYKNLDGDFVYEAVNPTWQNLVGLTKDAVVGKSPTACLPPLIAEQILNGWSECARERRPLRFSLEYPLQSGRQWDVVVLPIISDDGSVARLVSVGRDVTEQNRLAAAELQQAQKIDVMGQLAAGTSHDFNNILQVIAGGVEIIRDETSLSPAASDLLDMVQRATRRGASLTRHLLDYSRKQIWNPELLEFSEILGNLRLILSRTLGTHINVTVDVAPAIGLVRADRAQLETALMNLAINASHAMPDGGTLRIEVCRAAADPVGEIVGELGGGHKVIVAVIDTGTGISPQVLGRIFDPFFTTKGKAGNGLGLAMVQRFAQQAGGDVRVMSTLGEGSRFEIWLPAFDHPARQGSSIAIIRSVSHGGNVLLVDDAEDVLVVVSAFLRGGSFTVHQASSGQQALWMLVAGTRFDLLITDHMMPGMKGAALIRQVRSVQPDLPALVISGFADAVEHVADLANVIVLTKPFQRDELVDVVNRLITGDTNHPAMRRKTMSADENLAPKMT